MYIGVHLSVNDFDSQVELTSSKFSIALLRKTCIDEIAGSAYCHILHVQYQMKDNSFYECKNIYKK